MSRFLQNCIRRAFVFEIRFNPDPRDPTLASRNSCYTTLVNVTLPLFIDAKLAYSNHPNQQQPCLCIILACAIIRWVRCRLGMQICPFQASNEILSHKSWPSTPCMISATSRSIHGSSPSSFVSLPSRQTLSVITPILTTYKLRPPIVLPGNGIPTPEKRSSMTFLLVPKMKILLSANSATKAGLKLIAHDRSTEMPCSLRKRSRSSERSRTKWFNKNCSLPVLKSR